MMRTRFRFLPVAPFAVVAGLALGVVGCGGGDGISVTTAPKADGGKGGDNKGEYRLLGLMVPADDPVWYFKYNGPAEELDKYEADFDKLAASVKLAGPEPDFTAPAGWKRGPGREGFVPVFATVVTDDGKQEVSITKSGGGIEPNLDRWVGMIGLKPGPGDKDKYTKVIDGSEVKVRRVDLRGPKNPATNRMMGKQ